MVDRAVTASCKIIHNQYNIFEIQTVSMRITVESALTCCHRYRKINQMPLMNNAISAYFMIILLSVYKVVRYAIRSHIDKVTPFV